MKRSKFQLILLIVTLTCLIFLTGIQINWILTGARMQEAQFNHSVNMAMNRIVENLANERQICNEVSNCLHKGTSGSCYLTMKNRIEWANMGNMIKKDLKYYGINLDFEFDIIDSKSGSGTAMNRNVYMTSNLENILQQSGYELRIKFPEKKDFIKAQIGYIFISSIILLVLVSVSFLLIFRFYKREKRLSENIVDIINNMTHEFRTPLTNIALANSMISKNEYVERDEKLSSYTRVIRTEHNRLKERVDELLKTSFSESQMKVVNKPVNVSLLIGNVLDTFAVQIKAKNGKAELIKPDDDLIINGDSDSLKIAFGNLIDNAIKYNSGAPEIIVRMKSADENVVIEISDNGIGIAREYQSQIFSKYFRVPTGDVHDSNGFGLGLYYARTIFTSMGGRIRLSSSPGKGSKFIIEIPEIRPE